MSAPGPLPLTKTIVGYSNEISVAAGDTIKFMVSTHDDEPTFRADIVRLICGDDAPDGPGFQEEEVAAPISGQVLPARHQPIDAGSCVVVPNRPALCELSSFTLQAFVWPTTPRRGLQGLISRWRRETKLGFGLVIDENGVLALVIGNGADLKVIRTTTPLQERVWYLVGAAYDRAAGRGSVFLGAAHDGSVRRLDLVEEQVGDMRAANDDLIIGGGRAESGHIDYHFNGKIERPRLSRRALPVDELTVASRADLPGELAADIVAAWDFSQGIPTTAAIDVSPNGLHGHTVNMPTRAVTGVTWARETRDWRQSPNEYGAIHFHEDDLSDASWSPDFEITIPKDWRSGVYAARIRTRTGEDHIPFFVRHSPTSGARRNPVCLLFSTATYMAYANNHTIFDDPYRELEKGTLLEVRAEDLFLHEHREYGLSTYDTHLDGSGVCYSSRLRPVLNMRPKHALWSFNAATHILDWLEKKGFDYDILTDEDVHYGGLEVLAPYRVVLTDTHPEYVSTQMWDAFKSYQDSGGRFMYLGGNGYYWRISFPNACPGVIEVRRAENGTRGWASAPGEYYHSSNGEYGGLWRLIGRPPQQLVGVGYIAAGFDVSSYYRRKPASTDPRAAFVFEGVSEEVIGDFGLLGGGAAGWELDRFDAKLGSPAHALVLASSEHHSNAYMAAIEETHAPHIALNGLENPKVYADIVFYECEGGGAVFSTGSISWAASLSVNKYKNNVSEITENVLNRFLDPKPFVPPKG